MKNVSAIGTAAAVSVSLVCATAGLAQDEATVARGMEEVITIGTRTMEERTVTESAVPVDVFSSEDIQDSGISETSRLLQFLAPSFNFSTSTISDGTDIVRPSTLRGLGPDQTLVLVNGKRRHNSALVHVNGSIGRGTSGVDLNAIPPSAIQRIEILRDGAASQYGSDAIAGVINIVLKQQADSVDLKLQGGQAYAGDGETIQGSVNAGFPIGDTGFFNVTGEIRNRKQTNRSGRDQRDQYPLIGGLPDPREATFDRRNHRYGDPDSDNTYLYVNSSIPVAQESEIYFFGGIARREGESGGFYRRALDDRTVPSIHPDGFLPLITTDVDDNSLGAGFRASLGAWDVDASLTYGMNEFNFTIENSNNVSLGPASPTSADAGTLSFGQTTVNLDFVRLVDWGWRDDVNVALGAEWRQDEYEIEAGDFASFANGPDDDPATAFPNQSGGIAAAGIQVFPGFRPSNEVDEDRDSFAFYADLETTLAEDLLVGVAARYEDFSDFGTTLDGKLTLRYDFNEAFALRGSVSTGFRAPSLHQQFFNNTSTQFVTVGGVPNTPVEVGTFANNSNVVANGFQVGELEEETAVNLSGGFTWLPNDNWSITADIYRIDIEDRIVISGRFTAESQDAMGNACVIGTGNCPIADILDPFPGVSAAQFFSNAIDTETTGIDIVAAYATEFDNGVSLRITGGLNITDTELDGAVSTPATLQNAVGADQTLFSRQENIWLEDGQPEDKLNVAANVGFGAWSGTLRVNRFGEVKSTESAGDSPADLATDQTFDAKFIVDLDINWELDNGLRFTLGANNLFDEFPDENIEGNSFGGIFPYNRRTTPFGFNGGYYYGAVSYSFLHSE